MTAIIDAIDQEIARLTKVRELLAGGEGNGKAARTRAKRVLSAEARAKIAAAQRKRWAAQKKATKR